MVNAKQGSGFTSMALAEKEDYVVDLSALQAVCERNYWRLIKLLPSIRQTGYCRSIAFTVEEKIDTKLTFQVLENSPYTSYLRLKQEHKLCWLVAPQFHIRCYHDAQLAEVVFVQNTRSFRGVYSYPNPAMHQPDEKKQLNLFLEEWLNRCLSSGYEMKEFNSGIKYYD